MNWIYRSLFLFILMVCIIWWLTHPTAEDVHNKPSNAVTFKPSEPIKSQAIVNENNVDPNQGSIESLRPLNDELPERDDALTWLAVYRMQQDFLKCERLLEASLNDPDFNPVQGIIDYAQRINDDSGMPTVLQIKFARERFKQCEGLANQVVELSDSDDFLAASNPSSASAKIKMLEEKMAEILISKTPITAKEIRLSDALELIKQWFIAYNEVMAVSEGVLPENDEGVLSIKAQLKQIDIEIIEINKLGSKPELDDIQIAVIGEKQQELYGKKSQLNARLMTLRQVNDDERNKSLSAFSILNEAMFQNLKSADADVFYEAQMVLEQHNRFYPQYFGHMPYKDVGKGKVKSPFIEYISPGEVIQTWVDIPDDDIFGMVINYATLLYWCELGADCGPSNFWVESYCFNGYNRYKPESCGLDLRTFYQQHLLNTNQWDDVQWMLGVIRDMYAH